MIGIDVDIREHNRRAIEAHPLSHRISLLQGSSVDQEVVSKIKLHANSMRTMVVLDSNHTHAHVLSELEAYGPLVTKGCYLVVLDTVVENLPEDLFVGKPWGVGNSPKVAVHEFLSKTNSFVIDKSIANKLQVTVAPDGFLRRV